MIENNLLNILITFKKCGTLSKTADALNISQPSLSRSMQKLEEEMDVPIFIHGKNFLKLNENGELLASEAKKLLENQQKVIERIRQLDASNKNIHIGYSAPGPRIVYEPILHKQFSNSNISWFMNQNESELIQDLKEHKFDFIFIENQEIDSSLYSKICLKESLKICVTSTNHLSTKKQVSIQEIDGETFLQISSIGIWSQFVETKLPHSQIIQQMNKEDLTTLINNSLFSCFVTNITNMDTIRKYTNRIIIPISDDCATKNFIFVTTNTKRFMKLIQTIKQIQ